MHILKQFSYWSLWPVKVGCARDLVKLVYSAFGTWVLLSYNTLVNPRKKGLAPYSAKASILPASKAMRLHSGESGVIIVNLDFVISRIVMWRVRRGCSWKRSESSSWQLWKIRKQRNSSVEKNLRWSIVRGGSSWRAWKKRQKGPCDKENIHNDWTISFSSAQLVRTPLFREGKEVWACVKLIFQILVHKMWSCWGI